MAERIPRQFEKVSIDDEFPLDPDKRFEAIFAAIGNSEAKCITLLCLSEFPMTAWDLNREFNEVVAGAWKSSNSVQENYCKHTFVPLGLVEGEDDPDSSGGYFRLTEAGRKYGQPIAAYLVKNSLDFPDSLSGMFAMTGSGVKKSRPVINGIDILEALFESKEVLRTRDIAQKTEILDKNVGGHLRALGKLGLVDYKYVESDKGDFVKYKVTEDVEITDSLPSNEYPVLTLKVWQTLKDKREVGISEVCDLLKSDYPRMKERTLKSLISATLSRLSIQGKCSKVNFGHARLSKVKITELGEMLVGDIILPIRNAFGGNDQFFESCRKINWRIYASKAVLRHSESSGHVNQKRSSDSKSLIYRYINENPGARPKDIDIVFGMGKGIYLRFLEKSGLLTKQKEGRAVHYFSK